MIDAPGAQHQTLYRDPFAYCAHPQIVEVGSGDWLVVFNRSVRRPFILHPPHDPLYYNVVIRSGDRGESWSAPQVVPGYDWHGVECASLTPLRNGRVLLNQWRFRWYPLGLGHRLADETNVHFPEDFVRELLDSGELDTGPQIAADPERCTPWARGGGETFVHLSDDGGHSWTECHAVTTAPYGGGYGMRGAVELPDGDLLLPLGDVPQYETVFVVRSKNGGRSWEPPVRAASGPGLLFSEPCLTRLRDGRLLMLVREDRAYRLYRTMSEDDGRTWSPPAPTPIDGYPAHLLVVPDGRLLCTYGRRRPEYSIRGVLSVDGGETWDMAHKLRIRGPLPNNDLGYPCTLLDRNGSLFTVYYCQDEHGVTGIEATRWRL